MSIARSSRTVAQHDPLVCGLAFDWESPMCPGCKALADRRRRDAARWAEFRRRRGQTKVLTGLRLALRYGRWVGRVARLAVARDLAQLAAAIVRLEGRRR